MGKAEKPARTTLILASASSGIVAGGVASALTTLAPLSAFYMGLELRDVLRVFIAAYLIMLPLLLASYRSLLHLSKVLAGYCHAPKMPVTILANVLIPLGYVLALQALMLQIAHCSKSMYGVRVSASDLILNLVTGGAYSITYAIVVDKLLELVLREE